MLSQAGRYFVKGMLPRHLLILQQFTGSLFDALNTVSRQFRIRSKRKRTEDNGSQHVKAFNSRPMMVFASQHIGVSSDVVRSSTPEFIATGSRRVSGTAPQAGKDQLHEFVVSIVVVLLVKRRCGSG